ncbi:MAG: GTP-binding protein, partial [Anaerolineae bacterium]|nr:GTP-binding protein [Anaerolineae bacterium]
DIILLNKVDLVSAAHLQTLRDSIARRVPGARLLATTHARVPLALLLGVGYYDPARLAHAPQRDIHVHPAGAATNHDHSHEHDHDHSHDHNHEHDHNHDHEHPADHSLMFSTWHWSSTQPLALQALYGALADLPASIYRAKGFVYVQELPDVRCLLQLVGKRITLTPGEPWGSETPATGLVMIGTWGSVDADALRQRLAACVAAPAPARVTVPAGGLWQWLRKQVHA